MLDIRTPGVYVEEISTFPTSVVRVATAVPVFVGWTELLPAAYKNKAFKIKSLVEYQQIYGGEPTDEDDRVINVTLTGAGEVSSVSLDLKFYLYHSLRHYFVNGGGDAYIFSVDTYADAASTEADRRDDLIDALPLLEQYDEPTLVLTPDAFDFSAGNLGEVQKQVLAHCAKMQDRFAILDVKSTGDVAADALAFRTNVGTANLKYGASYYPPLASTLTPDGAIALESYTMLDVNAAPMSLIDLEGDVTDSALTALIDAEADLDTIVALNIDALQTAYDAIVVPAAATPDPAFEDDLVARATIIKNAILLAYGLGDDVFITDVAKNAVGALIEAAADLETVASQFNSLATDYAFVTGASGSLPTFVPSSYFDGSAYTDAPIYPSVVNALGPAPTLYGAGTSQEVAHTAAVGAFDALFSAVMSYLEGIGVALTAAVPTVDLFEASSTIAAIKKAIKETGYTMPPSGAMAGVFATVDASRGVWKAPANVSVNGVVSVLKMTNEELADLNVPSDGQGKSINAIRLFRGQGILVYGARTLAGNDNEWRYVPVRRLFIMVEESVKKATEPMVFEPNTANTWQMVKGMIENFLTGLWRDGALAGASTKDAFFVNVGLGQTMTAQDILEGKMIVEIGMAAVRPAEFVILRFSHMLQAS